MMTVRLAAVMWVLLNCAPQVSAQPASQVRPSSEVNPSKITPSASTPGAPGDRKPGYAYMAPSTQALQDDDSQNPAFLWVQEGRRRFDAACVACHSVASLRGVVARYPAWDTALAQPVTLNARINLCQTRHVKAPAWAPESDGLLSLETFVAHQSRGLPVQPPARDARLASALQQGQQLYTQRLGQLNLSCAQCHDAAAGGRLGGSTVSQAHPTGYPQYRLQWQQVGSLQRRLRHCMSGVRAEPYAWGSAELTALETYLMQRAAGMPLETPAVRP
jgi:L-cysteine S-thiosulfotransferase